MQEAIQSAVSVRDFVLLKNAMGNNTTVAEVLSASEENLTQLQSWNPEWCI